MTITTFALHSTWTRLITIQFHPSIVSSGRTTNAIVPITKKGVTKQRNQTHNFYSYPTPELSTMSNKDDCNRLSRPRILVSCHSYPSFNDAIPYKPRRYCCRPARRNSKHF
jgi:hypothetical protein